MGKLLTLVVLSLSPPAFAQSFFAPTNDATGPNFLCCAPVNSIDPNVHSVTVFGGLGDGNFPNRVGVSFAGVNGGPNDAYVPGSASYATISGGYDNINNALAGTIISQHGRLYTAATHGIIAGGGKHWISSGDSQAILGGAQHRISSVNGDNIIAGGANNSISGNGSASAIIGGSLESISGGAYSAIIGGYKDKITAPAVAQTIVGGSSNSITGGATFAAIVSGYDNSVSSNYGAILGGYQNTVTGYAGAVVAGDASEVSAPYAVAFGTGRMASWPGGIHYGARNQETAGDRSNVMVAQSIQTTSAVATGLSGYGTGDYPQISPSTAAITQVMVVGRQQHSNKVVAFTGTVVMHTGNGGVVTIDSQSWSRQVDNVGVAAPPMLSASSNQFTVFVTGRAYTTIDWNADVRFASVSGP